MTSSRWDSVYIIDCLNSLYDRRLDALSNLGNTSAQASAEHAHACGKVHRRSREASVTKEVSKV